MSDTYRVAVHREGRYWVAVVDGLRGGATEVRALSALEVEVRDLISALTDAAPDSFDLEWDYTDALPESAGAAIADVDAWRGRLAEAEAQYARAQAAAAARLSAAGVSVRDSASLLRVSPARVVQVSRPRTSAKVDAPRKRKRVGSR